MWVVLWAAKAAWLMVGTAGPLTEHCQTPQEAKVAVATTEVKGAVASGARAAPGVMWVLALEALAAVAMGPVRRWHSVRACETRASPWAHRLM